MEELLIKYYNKELNAQEVESVESWLAENSQNRDIYDDYLKIWTHAPSASIFDHIPVEEDWKRVKSQIRFVKSEKNRRLFLAPLTKIAATVALIITVGVLGYMAFVHETNQELVVNDHINANQNIILLSDGTRVTLNVNSHLVYPKKFKADTRSVELKGEAFFEVAKNPQKPFIIHHGKCETRVLGTKFNLRAYPHEKEVRVSVTEGTVQLTESDNKKNQLVLTHNRVGIYHRDTRRMARLESMNSNFLSWRTGVLTFQNSSLTKVVRDLKRHFRIDFVIQNSEKANKTFVSARFEKQKLKEVLDELSLVTGIPFSLQKNFVLVENK